MMRTGRVARWAMMLLALALTTAGATDEPRESWDAIYIQGQRVGYFHIAVRPVKDRERDLVRVVVDHTLSFKRGKDPVSMDVLYGTIETPDGSVLRLDTRIVVSRQEMRTFGDVADGKMKLILEGTGQRQEQIIPWEPDVRGPYGAEMSMSRKPMQPGESREIKVFVPGVNKISLIKLEARQVENVQLGGGVKRGLLRVDQTAFVDGKPFSDMSGTHWVDASGQVLRMSMESFGGMETYRTTKEAAQKNVAHGQFDLTEASLVKV
ncbi:MAG TPA: transglutaminase, partial [Isosphaeraceae bacterium]